MKIIIIDFLRHGRIDGYENSYIGNTDIKLSESGFAKMKSQLNNKINYSKIVSSPLSRCSEFAKYWSCKNKIELEVIDMFREINFGCFEKKTAKYLLQENPEQITSWWADMLNTSPPNGESLIMFRDRIMPKFNELVLNSNNSDNILFISHGGVIRVIIAELLGIKLDNIFSLQVSRGSISSLELIINKGNKNMSPYISNSKLLYLNK